MAQRFAFAYYPAFGALPDLGALNTYAKWWAGLVVRQGKPTRKSVSFTDLRGMHSRFTLCRVLEDNEDMVAHIVGEEVKALFKSYHAGKSLSFRKGTRIRELIDVSAIDQKRHLQKVTSGPSIALNRGRLTLINGRSIDVFALDFPLHPLPGEQPFVLTLYDFNIPPEDRGVPHSGLSAY
ncbi:hypothetical protein JCM17845_23220 [Iodidimonas gelatinilytica]|uniref:PAS domain-containing protein n=1 Tax=Iodidimonas gelatinilytica TaxID=1236966 RepID=A0A5A7N3M2_9PROT|nr:hypothetical protein [Iodidimonas gelatinilytica]GER01699.1 hypothetical protein JCM17845_23220 [Iodidimonas gelatinilytica]